MSHATTADTQRRIDHLLPLLQDTVEQHQSLVRGADVEGWVNESKISFAYDRHRAFERDKYSWSIKKRAGMTPDIITGSAVQEVEPNLGYEIRCLAVIGGQGHITDPGGNVMALVKQFTSDGGQFIRATLQDIHRTNGRVKQIDTDQGPFACSHAVITAGVWSGDLMKQLGLSVPMNAERGYHVVFEDPSQMPRNPMLMASGKFGVNPMDMGLRCAGTVELGDHHAPASQKPIQLLTQHAKRAFPNLRYARATDWMGFRPTTADALPLIDEISDSGLFAGFCHQHIGLTSGPKTGRILAQLISGVTPNADISSFDPQRFGDWRLRDLGQPTVLIAHQQMCRIDVFFDVRKSSDWLAKNIVGFVVIDRRNLANQDVAALAPSCMPIAWHLRDAFARGEFQFCTRCKITLDAVAKHCATLFGGKMALIVRTKQFDHQRRATKINNISALMTWVCIGES